MKLNRNRTIVGWVLSGPPVIAMFGGSYNKISQNPDLIDKLPYISSLPLLGLISLICVILYLIPKTSNVGFFLMCSYFGGVIVGELAMGEIPLVGIVLSICLYIGTMLRKPELSGFDL